MDSENFKIVGVSKDLVSIEILDPTLFTGQFNIGSYLKIPYKNTDSNFVVGIIKNYKIRNDTRDPAGAPIPPIFEIEVELIGSYKVGPEGGEFERGAHGIPLPPSNGVSLLSVEEYKAIYSSKLTEKSAFEFSELVQASSIRVPVDGNKFFNKHFAIVGSTGSGKSHTTATVLQNAISAKDGSYSGLNNSHIIIFDIHGEYASAFPEANIVDFNSIKIPYWLFDGDELGDLFIESNEQNSHNQVSQFRYSVTENKKKEDLLQAEPERMPPERIYYDTPLRFKIDEVINYIKNMNNELINKSNNRLPTTKSGVAIAERIPAYFASVLEFDKGGNSNLVNGPYSGDFERFILRLETIRNNPRLQFLFKDVYDLTLVDVLKQFLGYTETKSNVTVLDLSGIPFEVLSITVSLISRLVFEFGYYYKKILQGENSCETPLLLVYEEAHKYVPRSDLVKFRSSKNAIERIAKEGRKYGVTLGIVSQRPSEISETIFSQCNNFIAMRLTNPDDQNYVKRLLPDSLGDLTDYLPTLRAGEALIIGESISLPSLVKIDFPTNEPKSTDIDYLEIWKAKWKDPEFTTITNEWKK